MKKKSRFLTGLLSAVMALSLCALPATAEGNAMRVATLPDIETNKTGTVTIHKDEDSETLDEKTHQGTGEVNDSTKVPDDATPLGDVTFTLYQIKNGNELLEYYKSIEEDKAKQLNINDYVDMQTYTIKDAYKDNKNYEITTSNVDGASKGIGKETVDVGIYAVVETKVPAGVTGKTKPFLLSVPMTDNEGKNWLYDIDVFPKNQTSYTGIDLIKYGKTGGEITEGTLLDGFKFTLEKWNKTTEKWEPITNAAKNGQDNAGDALELTTVKGKISVSSLTKGIYRFTEIDGPADGAANSDYIIDTKTHYIFEAKEDENNAGQLTIANVTEDAKAKWNDGGVYNYTAVKTAEGKLAIVVDNYKPDLNKTVQKREKNTTTGEHDYVNDTDYSVGDEITYKLEVVVPENVADLKTFYVEDHPNDTKQLQYVAGSISVKASGQTASLEADTDYKFTEDETNGGFKIDFKAMNAPTVGNYKGQTLTITYKYKLLKDASLAVTGNVNKAELTYSHNAKTGTDEHENDNPHKIHDEAVVYTFATNIVKKGDDGKPLGDVEFELYKEVSGEEYGESKVLNDEAAKAKGLDTSKGEKWILVDKKSTSNESATKGQLKFDGLSNGTYYLVETKTNAGYNLLSAPVEAKLNITHNTTWKIDKQYDANNKLIYVKRTGNTTTFGNEDGTTNGFITITVINRKGFNLPVTGGFGTLLFSGIGALLVVGGIGVLMSIKKKKKGNA